jgi:hypothetical protein
MNTPITLHPHRRVEAIETRYQRHVVSVSLVPLLQNAFGG